MLADFNGTILASAYGKDGIEFTTWDWDLNRERVSDEHFFGSNYKGAKQDFATRSGLIPDGALFTPKQLTEVYRSIQDTFEHTNQMSEQRQRVLEGPMSHIKESVPDLRERVKLCNERDQQRSVLFSVVTVTAGSEEAKFLVGGIPREYDDLEDQDIYDKFLCDIGEETEIQVHAEAYLYYLISPDNLSVLSAEGVRGRVWALTELLRSMEAVELLALDSRESFQSNKHHYQNRLEKEELPALRELLRQDMAHLDEIQSSTASAREFAFAYRIDDKAGGDAGHLKQLEKRIRDCRFYVRLAEEQDVKRLLAVYYQQDVTTEHFINSDGEEIANG